VRTGLTGTWTRHDLEVVLRDSHQGFGDTLGIHELHLIGGGKFFVGVFRIVHDYCTRGSGRKVVLGQISDQPHDVILFGFHVAFVFHLPVGIAVTSRTTPSLLRIHAKVTSIAFPFAPVIVITWLYFVPNCVAPVSTALLSSNTICFASSGAFSRVKPSACSNHFAFGPPTSWSGLRRYRKSLSSTLCRER
jgi:hypothetical protein